MNYYVYIIAAFAAGFLIAWLLRTLSVAKMKKELRSVKGLLESERLIKETTQKENIYLIRSADAALIAANEKLRKTEEFVRMMDADILLLQKDNEETEELLAGGEPVIHELKLKLIEANNAIARYKAYIGGKLV